MDILNILNDFNLKMFLEYGSLGIIALLIVIGFIKDMKFYKYMLESVILMKELKILLEQLVWSMKD